MDANKYVCMYDKTHIRSKNPKKRIVFNANKHVGTSALFGYIPYFSGVCLLQPVLDEEIYSSLD